MLTLSKSGIKVTVFTELINAQRTRAPALIPTVARGDDHIGRAASRPVKVRKAALNRLFRPRSSKGRTLAVTSEAIQVRILAGEPRISGAVLLVAARPRIKTQGFGPLSYDRNQQYSIGAPSLQLRDHAP